MTIAAPADVTLVQLKRYGELIYRKIGVAISEQKATLLSNRLRRRLRVLGLDCYDKYFRLLSNASPDADEWQAFLQEITTHETYLFRDQSNWDWLRGTYIPEIQAEARKKQRTTTLRIWSAACSTGDEAATVACCLVDAIHSSNPLNVEIVGTDIGAATVIEAATTTFGERAMRLVPDTYRKRYFDKMKDGAFWVLKSSLRDLMKFKVHNLLDPIRESAFDLIFLKNVLIYFDRASKKRVLQRVREALWPGGYLITGAAEGVSDLLDEYESIRGWLHRLPTNA
jgi:chemotaxis protein methyltransferase CheR